jgi:hypothetical protein
MDEYQADRMIALLEEIRSELKEANSKLSDIASTNQAMSDHWHSWSMQNYPVATVESNY